MLFKTNKVIKILTCLNKVLETRLRQAVNRGINYLEKFDFKSVIEEHITVNK